MKNYTITVNGSTYDVTVEETGTLAPQTAAPAVAKAPAPAVAKPAAPAVAKAPAGAAGSINVEAGAQGKIHQIPCKVGQAVKAGDTVVVLEAMKMEIPVVSPQDGTVASIEVAVGDSVNAGQTLATLN